MVTRSEVPAGTFSRITESGCFCARISEVGGTQAEASASSRGISLQPACTFCAITAIGVTRTIKNGNKQRRRLNMDPSSETLRSCLGGLRSPPQHLHYTPG